MLLITFLGWGVFELLCSSHREENSSNSGKLQRIFSFVDLSQTFASSLQDSAQLTVPETSDRVHPELQLTTESGIWTLWTGRNMNMWTSADGWYFTTTNDCPLTSVSTANTWTTRPSPRSLLVLMSRRKRQEEEELKRSDGSTEPAASRTTDRWRGWSLLKKLN